MADKSIKQPSAKQPKWQRARIVKCQSFPEAVGLLIWVRNEPPFFEPATDFRDGTPLEAGFLSEINFYPSVFGTGRCVIDPENIERIPEFADDVPILDWIEFLAQATERHA